MKKTMLLAFVCALLALAGCQGKAAADSGAADDGGAAVAGLPADNQGGQPADDPADSLINDPAPQNGSGAADSDLPADSGADAAAASPHAAPPPVPEGDIVEIKEKMFIAQMNDIYYNTDDYLGKTIKYEGIFDIYHDPDTDEDYYFVIRYGPGCCGIDLNAGLEVAWDKGYPKQDDWVEAAGVLVDYEDGGFHYLRLDLSSLTVLDVRGAEYVSQ